MSSNSLPPICEIPRASVCAWCRGSGVEPDEESGELDCLNCNGRGVPTVTFHLPPSRTHRLRFVAYHPTARRLMIGQGPTSKWYRVEVRPDEPGWVGGKRVALVCEDGVTVYDLWTGDEFSCDCPGASFVNADKANKRALRRGEGATQTLGCVHLDACMPLARAGWFDVNF